MTTKRISRYHLNRGYSDSEEVKLGVESPKWQGADIEGDHYILRTSQMLESPDRIPVDSLTGIENLCVPSVIYKLERYNSRTQTAHVRPIRDRALSVRLVKHLLGFAGDERV